MKKLNFTILVACVTLLAASCKKENSGNISVATGTVNVVNAVVGGSTITLLNTTVISSNNTVGSNASAFFPFANTQNSVILGVPAVPATPTSAVIPQVTYINQALTDNTSNYSLFLTGTSPSAVESVLIKESYQRTLADSVCAVRIINLAPGSNPISVNIKNNATGSEAANIAYKAYSNFTQHPAKKVNPNYVFEFRDAASGTLLTTYTLATPYFHNVTLALRKNGSGYGVILNADY